MVTEVDDQLGRIFDWLDDTGQADNTLVVLTSRSRRAARRPLARAEDRASSTPRSTCRSSSAIPAPQFDATRGETVDAFTEHVDVTPTICELLGTDVPLQCDGRPLTPWLEGATPIDWRARGPPRARPPRSRQPPARRGVRRHAGRVRARGAPRRPRQVRAVLGPPRVPADLLRHRPRSRAARRTSPPTPRTHRRCSTTRSACSRGA